MNTPDITGLRSGKLVVLSFVGVSPGTPGSGGKALWKCRCDCGREVIALGTTIKSGRTWHCGCQHGWATRTHGGAPKRKGGRLKAYSVWACMKHRCLSPKSKAWEHYGGRGIRVCERWMKFENFFADMGEKPNGKSLDRIDVNGDYCPENCRWATWSEQAGNTRKNRMLTFKGRTQCLTHWCRELGLETKTVSCRLDKGWSIERALTTPSQKDLFGRITFRGKSLTVRGWETHLGLTHNTIRGRLARGWSIRRALTTPRLYIPKKRA